MTNKSGKRTESKGKLAVDPSQQHGFREEISAENLAKEALAETIREGGAFARENSNRFRV